MNCDTDLNNIPSDTLKLGEVHPMAHEALRLIDGYLLIHDVFILKEALSSCALSGNRTAEICLGTLNRLLNKEPVSDRYLMGLAIFLLDYEFKDNL